MKFLFISILLTWILIDPENELRSLYINVSLIMVLNLCLGPSSLFMKWTLKMGVTWNGFKNQFSDLSSIPETLRNHYYAIIITQSLLHIIITQSLLHNHYYTIIVTQSLLHNHCCTIIVTQSLLHNHYYTSLLHNHYYKIIVTQSLLHNHYNTIIITQSLLFPEFFNLYRRKINHWPQQGVCE